MRHSPARGFTLIELSVVIVVIALLLGSLLVPLATQVEQRKIAETEKTLDDITQALIGFALIHGRLPRPATSAVVGTEKGAACADEEDCTGFIPWSTLGISRTDAWGKLILYSVTPAFASATPFSLTTTSSKVIKTRDSAGTLQDLTTQSSPVVVAVVFSYGANNHGTTLDGLAVIDGSTTNLDEDTNNAKFNCISPGTSPACSEFVSRTPSTSATAPGGEFDDIVNWIAAPVLFNRMVTAGKLP